MIKSPNIEKSSPSNVATNAYEVRAEQRDPILTPTAIKIALKSPHRITKPKTHNIDRATIRTMIPKEDL